MSEPLGVEERARLRAQDYSATPPPWRARLFNGVWQVVDAEDDVVATGEDGPELELIAAAPALLDEADRLDLLIRQGAAKGMCPDLTTHVQRVQRIVAESEAATARAERAQAEIERLHGVHDQTARNAIEAKRRAEADLADAVSKLGAANVELGRWKAKAQGLVVDLADERRKSDERVEGNDRMHRALGQAKDRQLLALEQNLADEKRRAERFKKRASRDGALGVAAEQKLAELRAGVDREAAMLRRRANNFPQEADAYEFCAMRLDELADRALLDTATEETP